MFFDGLLLTPNSAKTPMPICTLPMLNGKVYAITDPVLAQAAFRSKDMSFDPFVIAFTQKMTGLSDEAMEPIKYLPEDDKEPCVLHDVVKEIHAAMVSIIQLLDKCLQRFEQLSFVKIFSSMLICGLHLDWRAP